MSQVKLIIEILGWFGMAINITMIMPQAFKIYQRKSAEGISKIAYQLRTVGLLLWILQAALLDRLPPYINYVMNLFVIFVIFWFMYDSKKVKFSIYAFLLAWIVMSIAVYIAVANGEPWGWLSHGAFELTLSLSASTFLTFCFTPQTIKTIVTKNIDAISMLSCILISITAITWGTYWYLQFGFIEQNPVYIVSGSFSFIVLMHQLPLIWMKLTVKKDK